MNIFGVLEDLLRLDLVPVVRDLFSKLDNALASSMAHGFSLACLLCNVQVTTLILLYRLDVTSALISISRISTGHSLLSFFSNSELIYIAIFCSLDNLLLDIYCLCFGLV